MNPMLNIAIRAARAAGDVIIRQIDHVQDLPVTGFASDYKKQERLCHRGRQTC